MKKIILNILKFSLIPLAIVFSFFNIVAGVAFISGNNVALGVTLITINVIGYVLAPILVFAKKEIVAGILSVASSITMLVLKNEFAALSLVGNNSLELYKERHLPSIIITGVILIFAIIKFVKVIKDIRRKKALKNREKAPSIFN